MLYGGGGASISEFCGESVIVLVVGGDAFTYLHYLVLVMKSADEKILGYLCTVRYEGFRLPAFVGVSTVGLLVCVDWLGQGHARGHLAKAPFGTEREENNR